MVADRTRGVQAQLSVRAAVSASRTTKRHLVCGPAIGIVCRSSMEGPIPTDAQRRDLLRLVDQAASEELSGVNLELWRERVRVALGSVFGDAEHPEVGRIVLRSYPGLIHSPHTVLSGDYAAAERKAIAQAAAALQALAESAEDRGIAEGVEGPGDRHSVFLVHGRDAATTTRLKTYLRSLGLQIVEWEHAVHATGEPNPYVGEVVAAGLGLAHAVVVLFTPDDLVRLRPELATGGDDASETEERGQPRPNVLYEAGMAQALARSRTVLVAVGDVKVHSDVDGRHLVRFDGSPSARNRLAGRLELTGLEIDTTGEDWLDSDTSP